MAKNKIYTSYEDLLDEELKDPKLAMAYLNETLHDEDHNVFLIALSDVLRAQGQDISALAQRAQITRQNLYRMLSQRGNPRWKSITSLMDAMGMEIKLKYKPQRNTGPLQPSRQPVRQQRSPALQATRRGKL